MMKHTIDSLSHPLKESFLAQVYGNLDDRLIDQYKEEYVKEGEHQDGIGFWNHFEDAEGIIEDFKRYVAFAVETD